MQAPVGEFLVQSPTMASTDAVRGSRRETDPFRNSEKRNVEHKPDLVFGSNRKSYQVSTTLRSDSCGSSSSSRAPHTGDRLSLHHSSSPTAHGQQVQGMCTIMEYLAKKAQRNLCASQTAFWLGNKGGGRCVQGRQLQAGRNVVGSQIMESGMYLIDVALHPPLQKVE